MTVKGEGRPAGIRKGTGPAVAEPHLRDGSVLRMSVCMKNFNLLGEWYFGVVLYEVKESGKIAGFYAGAGPAAAEHKISS
jgi:hypothetical protein